MAHSMKMEGSDKVVSTRGDVLAVKVHGEWLTKDDNVIAFINEQEAKAAAKPAKATKAKPKAVAEPVETAEEE